VFYAANFTSRTRTPKTNQIVLVKNKNGYVAALKLKKIAVTDEGAPGTILEADYRILTDKSVDFSGLDDPEKLEIVSAIREAQLQLRELKEVLAVKEPDVATKAVIGHNQPPNEFALSQEEFSALRTELDSLNREIQKPIIEKELIEEQLNSISEKSSKIAGWLHQRLSDIQNGAFQALGATITTAAVLKLTGYLDVVLNLVGKLL